MIQVLGLRDWKKGDKVLKRETFFSKGWRFPKVEEVFDSVKLDALLANVPESERYNLYFTVAECYEESGRKLREQWAIPFDIDGLVLPEGGELEAALKAAQAGADALRVPLEEMGVVFTGNGVQFFILLDAPILDDEYFDRAREQYGVLAKRIQGLLIERGIEGNVDTSVWSRGRLMRLPHTMNRKPGKPERMSRILNGTLVARAFDLEKESGVTLAPTGDTMPDVVLKNYPKPDTDAVCSGCKFLSWCKDNPAKVSEPQWYADISVRARLDNGRDLVHEVSAGHPDYSHYETENKIEQALSASGPRTCKSIEAIWDGCKECEHYGKVTSPIMIKGEGYIASRDFGFRQRKIADGKVKPGPVMYQDLVKEFGNEHPFKTVNDNDQVAVFNGKFWEYRSDRMIKAWVMTKVRPEPNANEMSEFVSILKAFNVVTMEELYQRKEGYMNFSNCVLNTKDMTTSLHSPEYGFFSVLPYAYDPRATAPMFNKFLLDVMSGDEELAETIKEYAGYCISGETNWLQKSLLIVGDGANGKSVLMEILGDVVGKDNHTAISMRDLAKDTMRYHLARSLFNYSEETGVKDLADSSVFKLLTSGGVMSVKQLYAQPYAVQNRAKIILSANEMPYSNDSSNGLLRRLAIIRFKRTFKHGDEGHDYFIKDKLRLELPGICNELIAAYRKLKDRGHLTGMAKLTEELEEYRNDNDTALMFIRDMLVPTEGAHVKALEAYEMYVAMCEQYGFKPMSIIWFGRAMGKHLYPSIQKKVDGKNIKVYPNVTMHKEF